VDPAERYDATASWEPHLSDPDMRTAARIRLRVGRYGREGERTWVSLGPRYWVKIGLRVLAVPFLFTFTLGGISFCQTFNTPVIRVQTNEVQVPVFVFDKKIMLSPPPIRTPYDFQTEDVVGLTSKDFHVFEDGREQAIRSVRWVQDYDVVNVRDNLNNHNEISDDTPRGKWITSHTLYPLPTTTAWPPWLVQCDHFYVLGYLPPQSPPGSCHRVEVKVDRPGSVVYARSEYCNTEHSSSDPLNGSSFSHQLEEYARLDETGKIALSLQSAFFYEGPNRALVDVAVKIPTYSLNWRWITWPVKGIASLSAKIGILGLVYDRGGGALVTRFSSMGCCPPDVGASFVRGWAAADPEVEFWSLPVGYETQVDLPAGQYNLVVVLSDGSKFGRVERPVTVEPYNGSSLAISSVMLSKRYRNAAVAAKEEEETHFVPEYIPLVSNGVQFAPAGDTRFERDEPLFAYFEVYEPLLVSAPSTTVQTRMRITDLKNGKLKVDTGLRSAADWIQPGSSVIHIAEQVAIRRLSKGTYELEVQASDSAGQTTAWRTASFTVK
jgi:hypothetical protein